MTNQNVQANRHGPQNKGCNQGNKAFRPGIETVPRQNMLNECKKTYRLWVASGRTDNIFRIDNVVAKRELRKQFRKEKFTDRRNFYAELMSNPSTDKFYQLIRKNNGNRRQNAECILAGGEEVTSPEKQRLAFAKYYEDLSVPKDQGYDSAYLELCSARHSIITQICEESTDEIEPFTEKDVRDAIFKLNNKKAADEYGLTAEHLKLSGHALIEDITGLFNHILQSRTVPASFKSGILTPVLKKGKGSDKP